MKLYYAPDACSLAIHVILEEIGQPFTIEKINLKADEHKHPPFSDINPKQKVPVLDADGTIITELPAIAYYLARSFPDAALLPSGIMAQTRALELIDYMVATVHMRGFARLFRTSAFTSNPVEEASVRETGRKIVEDGLGLLAEDLGDAYLLGSFSIADIVLFLYERWARVRVGMTLPDNLSDHYLRVGARPATIRALAAEGLA